MTNSATGEASFEALGRNWTVKYDVNTICLIEDRLDKGFGEIGQGIVNGRLGYVRAVLWAAMVQVEPKLTMAEVGKAIHAELGLKRAGELVLGAMRVAFPDVFAAAEGEGGDGPQ